MQRFNNDEIIIDSYKLMIDDTKLTAQKILSSRLNWSREWMRAIDEQIEADNISEEAVAVFVVTTTEG